MKTQHDSRKLLGATQPEMAMLLKIHRSQWSMYESGKRPLPTQAAVLLAQLLEAVHAPEKKSAGTHPQLKLQQDKLETELKSLLKENQYQLEITARKLNVLENKYEAGINALQLAHHLAADPESKKTIEADLIKGIQTRAEKSIAKTSLITLAKLRIKHGVLLQEELLLKKALGR
jgi:transcriptional regulator with XRE-family HTH domain